LKPPQCFPGSNDPKCRQSETPSDGSALFPVPLQTSTYPPIKPSQNEEVDFHGKDQDPRYHAFHSCKYFTNRHYPILNPVNC
jgi:hypothetical protein